MTSHVRNETEETTPYQDRACFQKPTSFSGFGKTIDYIICFDENGCSANLRVIEKKLGKGEPINDEIRYFTLTGCLFSRNSFSDADFLLRRVKRQYWQSDADKVLFHSRDIRHRDSSFFFSETKYQQFIGSLSTALSLVDCTIFSITFDLLRYAQLGYTYDPYGVAFDLLTPRIIHSLPKRKTVAFVFESRGEKENKELLEHAKEFLVTRGTKTMPPALLQKIIRGVFFVTKSTAKDERNIYPGIEIADLFSYPIHCFARYGKQRLDFAIVEEKLANYPDYMALGLLLFPETWLAERTNRSYSRSLDELIGKNKKGH